jgi:hypothetical protein
LAGFEDVTEGRLTYTVTELSSPDTIDKENKKMGRAVITCIGEALNAVAKKKI